MIILIKERIKAGLASVIAVHNMIAIGTTHGHILCFDASQTLRWCCADYLSHGAVSALAFNAECTRLLVGKLINFNYKRILCLVIFYHKYDFFKQMFLTFQMRLAVICIL